MRRYDFYVNVGSVDDLPASQYVAKVESRLEAFKKIIEAQNFFEEGDKVLYIPSDETSLSLSYDSSWEEK
jgi:hypothetical protein